VAAYLFGLSKTQQAAGPPFSLLESADLLFSPLSQSRLLTARGVLPRRAGARPRFGWTRGAFVHAKTCERLTFPAVVSFGGRARLGRRRRRPLIGRELEVVDLPGFF